MKAEKIWKNIRETVEFDIFSHNKSPKKVSF